MSIAHRRWVIARGAVVALWLLAFSLGVLWSVWWVPISIAVIHLLEFVTIGLHVGRRFGRSLTYTAVMTGVFGFVWWLPLIRSISSVSAPTQENEPSSDR